MRNQRLHWIDPASPPDAFPPVEIALREPEGLLAVGGDLSPERLLAAYRRGIFPWFVEGQPILWWSPDPRCLFRPASFHRSKTLRKAIRRSNLTVTFNQQFEAVMQACAEPRPHQDGTWITRDMLSAFTLLHRSGWAHSVEVLDDGELIGGIYGLAIGRAFFGESMFSRRDNASKFAMTALLAELTKRDFLLLDGQVESPHLLSLGADMVPRAGFIRLLDVACDPQTPLTGLPNREYPVSGLLVE
ncbi:MAG: leucyl/phenylalanyl-tRNA--protein transferase [Pseudomonadota bacterium]